MTAHTPIWCWPFWRQENTILGSVCSDELFVAAEKTFLYLFFFPTLKWASKDEAHQSDESPDGPVFHPHLKTACICGSVKSWGCEKEDHTSCSVLKSNLMGRSARTHTHTKTLNHLCLFFFDGWPLKVGDEIKPNMFGLMTGPLVNYWKTLFFYHV